MEVRTLKGQESSVQPVRQRELEEVRTFVFEREQTQQSLLVDIKLALLQEKVDLSTLFAQYCPTNEHKISLYDPDANAFIPLAKLGAETTAKVPRNLLETQIIMVRFKRRKQEAQNTESDSGVESGLEEGREKKDRSKQRTIGESIELVKQWRSLHLSSVKSGLKKMSLSEAARAVGVSKKSLDDYYYQLRLGEFYNFDFANNLDEKVGILRAYVKEFKPDREMKNKNLRHPKNLKIIEAFEIDVPVIVKEESQAEPQVEPQVEPASPMAEQLRSPLSLRSFSLEEESFSGFEKQSSNPFLPDVMSSYEDKFFKNFEFMLDDPNDPFIELNHNFKKKATEEPHNSSEFFFF